MQLMEVRSAKLPRGFSTGRAVSLPRRRQWPPIPTPAPRPALFLPLSLFLYRGSFSFPPLQRLAGPEKEKGREKPRWWRFEIVNPVGGRGRAALIPAARFRSQFSRALTRLHSSVVPRPSCPSRPPAPSPLFSFARAYPFPSLFHFRPSGVRERGTVR